MVAPLKIMFGQVSFLLHDPAKERPTVDWKRGNTVTTTLLLVKVFLLGSTQLNYIVECLKTRL